MEYAIIEVGDKQEKVEKGSFLLVDKLNVAINQIVEFPIIFHSNISLNNKPLKAKGKVIDHISDKKIKILKFKNKTRYHKKNGHKQKKTNIKITNIK